MLYLIEIKLQKLGVLIDEKILKKSIFHNFFCVFFDLTSKLTNFLLFDKLGYPLFLFSIGTFIHYDFSVIHDFFLKIKLFGFSKIFEIYLSMPLGFQFCILFFFIFYQGIFINTVLAYSNKIQLFMKNKYHENIMKDLHYNSGLSSALRCLVPAATAVCIFCGKDLVDASKVKTVSNDWKDISEIVIKSGKKPPEQLVQVLVHTTFTNSTTINIPNIGIFDNNK